MFDIQGALQSALDGVWANTIGRLAALIPDWAYWIASQPLAVWVALLIGLVAGYIWAKWGWAGVLALGAFTIAVFTLGRNSKGKH